MNVIENYMQENGLKFGRVYCDGTVNHTLIGHTTNKTLGEKQPFDERHFLTFDSGVKYEITIPFYWKEVKVDDSFMGRLVAALVDYKQSKVPAGDLMDKWPLSCFADWYNSEKTDILTRYNRIAKALTEMVNDPLYKVSETELLPLES